MQDPTRSEPSARRSISMSFILVVRIPICSCLRVEICSVKSGRRRVVHDPGFAESAAEAGSACRRDEQTLSGGGAAAPTAAAADRVGVGDCVEGVRFISFSICTLLSLLSLLFVLLLLLLLLLAIRLKKKLECERFCFSTGFQHGGRKE